MKILLVEDDRMIGESLCKMLNTKGYSVDWARDGEMGDESLRTGTYNLLLLDVGLPKASGLEILAKLRARGEKLPVLIMTARDAVSDRVKGLDLGADDYLIKPFAVEELEARMRVLLRRSAGQADPLIKSGGVVLNTTTKELTFEGKCQVLSAREYALMFALMETPGKVLSRSDLEEKLYGWNEEVGSNAVEVLIHSIRKKYDSSLIRNIRGMGYMVARV